MEGGPFRLPLALERPKKPSINRVNTGKRSFVEVSFKSQQKKT